jgi:hypothetical protein
MYGMAIVDSIKLWMIENWISGEHYSEGLSGQTISISYEISKLQVGCRYECPCESVSSGY